MCPERSEITGVILAGGRARRMGGEDKGLIRFRGQPLVKYALVAVREVAARVLINANRNQERYASFGCPVISDATASFDGPLAGLLGAMKAAETPYVLAVPCDSPLMTGALLQRLITAFSSQPADVCVAHDGERMHPVFLMVARSLMESLEEYLRSGERKIDLWLMRHRWVVADYSDRPDVFVNVNTPDELADLEGRISVDSGNAG